MSSDTADIDVQHTHNGAHTCLVAVNQCDPPVEVENGNITFRDSDPANILPGDMIEYVCDDGTELNGSHYRYCQRNGNWSDEEPQCIGNARVKCSRFQSLYEILAGNSNPVAEVGV